VSAHTPETASAGLPRHTTVLLNVAHALDHMFMLIFAAAIAPIATEFGVAHWEDLMPYGVGAFVMFGLGSIPAGRLGDLWGRRATMLLFFFGVGISSIVASLARSPLELAIAFTFIGTFCAIYHPVGIPMIVQGVRNLGATIGINGFAGNFGVALAALVTGLIVHWAGWRAAFWMPGLFAIACGVVFALTTPRERVAPARRTTANPHRLPDRLLLRVLAVITGTGVTGNLIFQFTTNGNAQLLAERFDAVVRDPATLGLLLAAVYAVASVAQVIVGRLIDRVPVRSLYRAIVLCQVPVFVAAAHADGWIFFVLLLAAMACMFGAIPFTDAIMAKYVDDQMRSRVAGVRTAITFGTSALAVWALGPIVKASGFLALLYTVGGIAVCTAILVTLLPRDEVLAAARVRN
jgi:MFS family permease